MHSTVSTYCTGLLIQLYGSQHNKSKSHVYTPFVWQQLWPQFYSRHKALERAIGRANVLSSELQAGFKALECATARFIYGGLVKKKEVSCLLCNDCMVYVLRSEASFLVFQNVTETVYWTRSFTMMEPVLGQCLTHWKTRLCLMTPLALTVSTFSSGLSASMLLSALPKDRDIRVFS